ncbi:hypothetical protein ABZX75_12920 [Streptomyces sp. NPDC003038]|uniref:hypothetical protein n=1 Tax=unclassified Streptomyces TaxID=2593676 RepID=UPI00339FCCF8
MTEKPSLLAYLKRYAAGEIPREEMIATVAAWDFEESDWEEGHIEPSHQDNTASILYGSFLLGEITEEDYDAICDRRSSDSR